jgi:hypothetical protein
MKISSRSYHGFSGGPRFSMTERIGHIADAVRVSELNIFAKQPPISNSPFKSAYQVPDVKSPALYIPTDVRMTFDILDHLDLTENLPKEEIKAADLGSGLGAFVLSFAAYSANLKLRRFSITGYEISRSLLAGAQKIAEEQNIKKVRFIEKDFTQLVQDDFKKFNFIYIFCPFIKDFVDIMDNVYPRIAPETLLLTRYCPDQGVLRSGLFRLIDIPLEELYGDAYFLYRRTNEKLLIH